MAKKAAKDILTENGAKMGRPLKLRAEKASTQKREKTGTKTTGKRASSKPVKPQEVRERRGNPENLSKLTGSR